MWLSTMEFEIIHVDKMGSFKIELIFIQHQKSNCIIFILNVVFIW